MQYIYPYVTRDPPEVVRLRKGPSRFNQQGQVVAKVTSQFTSEMGANSWASQRVLGHRGISWTERKEPHPDHTDTAPSNARGFKQAANKTGLLADWVGAVAQWL